MRRHPIDTFEATGDHSRMRSALRPSSCLLLGVVCLPALWLPACAAARSSPTPAAPSASVPSSAVFEDTGLGFRFALPDKGFHATDEEGWLVASGDVGVRVFPVFTPGPADLAGCHRRVLELDLMPGDLDRPVASPADVATAATEGLAHGGRRLFARAFPREDACLVAVVDGRDDAATASAAGVVLGTFAPLAPDVHVRPLLKMQAGWELLRTRHGAEALERFEACLALAPGLSRARLGAGLAAAMLGRDGAAKAVEHLGRALADGGEMQPEAHRDALMYLGLAYAWLGRLAPARGQLAEAAVRYPGDPTVTYNLACVEALAGNADEAMFQLRAAFSASPDLVDHARGDEDLVSLRARPDFRELLAPVQDAP